jgi:hypothetical protein
MRAVMSRNGSQEIHVPEGSLMRRDSRARLARQAVVVLGDALLVADRGVVRVGRQSDLLRDLGVLQNQLAARALLLKFQKNGIW